MSFNRNEVMPTPKPALRDYQRVAVEFLRTATGGAGLFLDMGLG